MCIGHKICFIYEGESIIIRNAVAFVCLLAALSFSRSSLGVVSFLSLLHKFEVARSVPLLQLLALTVATPLSICTKEEQRSVIHFLWFEGVSGAKIHQILSAQYGNSVLPQWSVYEWIEKFKNSRTSVTREEEAGRPSMATTDDNVDRARYMVLLDV
jgi:hypothetical protein